MSYPAPGQPLITPLAEHLLIPSDSVPICLAQDYFEVDMYHAAMSERKDRRELKCILGWRKVDSSLEIADRIEVWSRCGALEGQLMTKCQLEEEAAAGRAQWLAHKKKNPLPWDTDYEEEEDEDEDGEDEDEEVGQPFSTVVLGSGVDCNEEVITKQADFWEEEEEDSGEESGEGDAGLEETI